jgi:hypothetical protein
MKQFNLVDENGNEIKAEVTPEPTEVTINHSILKNKNEGEIEISNTNHSISISGKHYENGVAAVDPYIPEPDDGDAGEDLSDYLFPATLGQPDCYIYFDMEFTGLNRNAEPISIGLVDNIGRSFYAVFNDYDDSKITDWLKENVIPYLDTPTENVTDGNDWRITGNRSEISAALNEWVKILAEGKTTVQFVADVGHYDFVLLIDLLLNDPNKTALDLPEYISPCLYDINQNMSSYVFVNPKEPIGLVPIRAAFDIDRDKAVKDMGATMPEGTQHNALFDAKVAKAIHNQLWNIK